MSTARKLNPEAFKRASSVRSIEPEFAFDEATLTLNTTIPHAHPNVMRAVEKAVAEARQHLGITLKKGTVEIPESLADAFVWDLRSALAGRNIEVQKSGRVIEIIRGDEDEDPYNEIR